MPTHQLEKLYYYMNARHQKIVARFGQVITFLDANTSAIPTTSLANQRQTLTDRGPGTVFGARLNLRY